ncbi:MAG TPA: OsmC family protein [Gaiellaceae bacterium]|nr:OsmC family protein [Gaiellaceae bacterium]
MSTSATPLVRPKEFHFPVTVDWRGGRRVAAGVDGKESVEIAPPPVFRGGEDAAIWSPEDFFVAAAASCLAVTFTGLAERAGLEYRSLTVDGDGVCSLRSDGHFGFTRLLLEIELVTKAGDEDRARQLAAQAEEKCLVSASLDVAIETAVEVRHE